MVTKMVLHLFGVTFLLPTLSGTIMADDIYGDVWLEEGMAQFVIHEPTMMSLSSRFMDMLTPPRVDPSL